jgi:hypothetical protein
LNYFFGVEVKTLSNSLLLTAEKYATYILRHAGMLSCKPVATHMATSEKLSALAGDRLGPEDVTKYRSLIGAL